jgi:multicomponent K+:H+ antiporter subunit C
VALLMASFIGVLTAAGVWLLLRPRTFDAILGLTLLSYAVNLFLFSMGRLVQGRAPIVGAGGSTGYADPLPQALVLTAIVIGFAMTALLLVLAVRAHAASGDDTVDGDAPADDASSGSASADATAGGVPR